MKKQSDKRLLADDELEAVSGGATKAYLAAVDVMNGVYGTGEACRQSVTDLGLDYWSVQHMANALAQGYGQVAQDVIDLKYGNGSARFKALVNAGYDPRMVQQIVNGMLLDD
ncbi:MAG: hypothetical protein ABS900_06450 [Candidatus Limivicinus sp.]|jgi:hypothetical protein